MNEQRQPKSPRQFMLRYFLQFSLRSLLIVMTLAAIACWWLLQPQLREEQLGKTSLRLQRQVRLVQFDPADGSARAPANEIVVEAGKHYGIVNDGRWRLADHGRNLLVTGKYRNGKREGKWTTYHDNGRKAAEGRIAAGKKVGLWRTWDADGRLIEEATFP